MGEHSRAEVVYEGQSWPVILTPLSTVRQVMVESLINHGLPVQAYDRFVLITPTGDVLRTSPRIARSVGILPDQQLTLEYRPLEGQ